MLQLLYKLNKWNAHIENSLCVSTAVHCVQLSHGQPGFPSFWREQQSFLLNSVEASQWLPSGHYEDQLHEAELQTLVS